MKDTIVRDKQEKHSIQYNVESLSEDMKGVVPNLYVYKLEFYGRYTDNTIFSHS